jgi:DNA-binding NarL/FixJ family response regulator
MLMTENGTHPQATGAVSGSARRQITLLVVDDHPAVRFGLVQLLEGQPDFSVEAVCVDAESAVAHAMSRPIDVAVVDYQLPGHNGLWVCRRCKQAPDAPRVVVFSAFADAHLAACAAVAGAEAVLNKGVLGSELCDAVRSVARGRRLQAKVPQPLAEMLRRRLSAEEQMLFGMLLAAIPSEEICRALRISERELESRRELMLGKLEALPGAHARGGQRPSRLRGERTAAQRRFGASLHG